MVASGIHMTAAIAGGRLTTYLSRSFITLAWTWICPIVYGGLQDNSSWVGASEYPGGITNHQWENMYGGDGFWMFVDPTDPDYLYAEYQGGGIARVNRKTHENRNIQPRPHHQ